MKITIDRLSHLGDGVSAGPDGPIYVAGALPGEVVEGDLAGDKLCDMRIVTPSTHRVRPPCPHARTCGGCQLQHASDGFVADWKQTVVAVALAGQRLVTEFRPIVTSPASTRRRASFSARRTKSGALVGFHARGSDTVVAIPQCKLLHPDLAASLAGLEDLVRLGGSRSGELSLKVTLSAAGVDVDVSGGKPMDGLQRMELARIVEKNGFARLSWNDEVVAQRDSPVQRFGRAVVTPPPAAFLQATREGEDALISAVRDALGPQKRIVDLFAGLGTFTFPLAEIAEVHSVEGDAEMTAAVEKAARQTDGLHRIVSETRDLFRRPLEPDEFKAVTGVVIDPPRAGAEAQVGCLARSGVPVIAMVSCNPITFARDARILVDAGYGLDWVRVIDQFRWSTHVELAARFSRQP